MTSVLYNPLAANKNGEQNAKKLVSLLDGELNFYDITKLDAKTFIDSAPKEDKIIIAGGDGTLNCLINSLHGRPPEHSLWYFPAGSGNDFMKDVGAGTENSPLFLDPYISALPKVTVNGETRFFLNGIGYGIDGYCCETGDRLRRTSAKAVNYTSIAIKGLLFHFQPADAVVTVDGKEYNFKKVWLAPTMNGRYYGGGMMVAPDQDRLNPGRSLSFVVMHGSGKLKTLRVFPSIFKGEHIKHGEMITVLTGRSISVSFSRPCALQIDGETVKDVTSYSAKAAETIEPDKITEDQI